MKASEVYRHGALNNIVLFSGMSHAQAEAVCREIGAQVKQDGRGGMRLEFAPCDACRSPVCAEMQLCARPGGDAA